ncbi:hypothetical protein ACFLVX_04990 [Chloroflexota bacterium]
MGKRTYKVSDQIAFRWSRRKRRGDSYRQIALDEGYDRRFVAKVVKEFDRQHQLQEDAATLREVRVAALRQHLQMLEEAALELLELAARPVMLWPLCLPPPNVRMPVSNPNMKLDLPQRISSRLSLLTKAPLQSSGWFRQHIAEQEARAIVENLKEHLPGLWQQIETWELIAARKQESCRKLIKHLKYKKIPLNLFGSGLEEGLRLCRSQESERFPPLPDKVETPQDVGLWLFRSATTRESLEALRRSLDELADVYSRLEDMLIPSKLRQTLLERKCSRCPVPQDELPPREITE